MTTTTMTRAPALPRGAHIPDWVDPDTFISPDPPPLPDAMLQEPSFTDIMSMVRRRFKGQPDTLVSGDSFLYYDRNDLNRRYEPDCYVAFGVDVEAIMRRNGYMVWVAGKPPDFVLEIASESTWERDQTVKRRDYARIGIREYWRFDAEGKFYDVPLAGDRLVNGQYVPIDTVTDEEGRIWGYSEELDLWLCRANQRLLLWDPKTGRFVRNFDDAEDALAETQERLAETQDTLAATQEMLAETQGTLATTQEMLAVTREALTATLDALEATRETLETTQDRLAATQAGKQNALERLAAAEETIRRLREQSGESEPGPGG